MDKNKRVEISSPIFFILVSIYILIIALTLPGVEGIFPAIIAVCMFIPSVILLCQSLKTTKSTFDISKINIGNLIKISVALIVYSIIINFIGYIISTFLLGAYTIYALGLRDMKKIILYPLAIVLITFICFKLLLSIPLPMAFLDF